MKSPIKSSLAFCALSLMSFNASANPVINVLEANLTKVLSTDRPNVSTFSAGIVTVNLSVGSVVLNLDSSPYCAPGMMCAQMIEKQIVMYKISGIRTSRTGARQIIANFVKQVVGSMPVRNGQIEIVDYSQARNIKVIAPTVVTVSSQLAIAPTANAAGSVINTKTVYAADRLLQNQLSPVHATN